MRLASERVLERLLANEPCHGAVFLSYSFDPVFFEQQILHGLLRLTADPLEESPRFLEEARARLKETPVVCIVDASMRQAGRRLPYDLLEVDRVTFHPKLALLLYATHARLLVGSGNLTRAGHGEQSELFFQRHLPYDEPEAVGLLHAVMRFIDQAAALARCRGAQLDHVRDEIARRARETEPAGPTDVAFLTSFDGAILPRFLALIPGGWKISRVSLLAPFHEQDDAQTVHVDKLHSVLATLARQSATPPEVELGVAWDDAPLGAGDARAYSLEAHLGRLWGRVLEDDTGKKSVDYFVLDNLTGKQAHVRDRRGTSRRWSRFELAAGLESGHLFPVAQPTVYGPVQAARLLHEQGVDITLALHPAQRYEDGRACRRPLHAKLYLVEASRRGATRTWVLMGSANASRPALLHGADRGNVEATVAFVLDGSYRLADFAPELVHVPLELVELAGCDFPPGSPNLGAWIEEAVLRAKTSTLEVRWAAEGPAPLGPWVLRYRDQAVAEGQGPPGQPTCVTAFTLASDAAELSLETAGGVYSVPILVDDLAALPSSPVLAELSLRELLALLGRRIGQERLETLRRPGNSKVPVDTVLEQIFGPGFGPGDVLKAWRGVATDLAKPDQSFAAFRSVIEGHTGARAAWDKLRAAVGTESIPREEAWFYGAELRRTLAALELPELIDRPDREALLRAFLGDLARELDALRPDPAGRTWLEPILSFYGGEP